jgi:hypothetical protein
VVEGPIRAIEQPINLARHDEVVLMQSFDLLRAQRDSSITPAEADVRVMAFCLGKLTKFGCGFTWHLSIKVLRLRGAVARLFLCGNGLLRTCLDRNRTNVIGITLVAAMAGPKTPRELADRMRDHRAQHRARDGFVRETFTQPRDDTRQTVREFLDRYPTPAYMSEVEHWRELSGGEIEFTMRRLRTAV